nr:hypothetical protein [Tanacetum cinerariifolium]
MIEEMLYRFIEEGKQEHEEIRAFIRDFQTTNEILFKERNNLLIEFRFEIKEGKEEAQQKKFLENLKQLHINLPFIKALAQMPKYAKFLKGLLKSKVKLEEACTITMNERCSAVLLNKLPSKEKDPWSFTIPCDMGQLHINNALEDLGASISLMPYMMYEKLGLDFVILDIPEDSRVPIILGRPFLATAQAMIDVFNKKIMLRVGDDEVIFDVDQSIKRPPIKDDECYGIDDLDDTINAEAQELLTTRYGVSKTIEYHISNILLNTTYSFQSANTTFIEEGKQEHEEIRAFIRDFQTTNEILFKERNNLLIEFRFEIKEGKEEAQQKKFLENLKQLHINLPFIKALAQMPKYAKFLKGLLKSKVKLEEACTITMNERCSAVLLNKLPSKEKDPWSFTIPCDMGQLHINNALEDLGASISLMPYMMYEKLGLDFVILDIPEDSRVPIILGRPFLATAQAMIDVFNKKIMLRVGDDEVIFDVDQSIKRPPIKDDECYGIDDLDDTINAEAQELLVNDKPDLFLSRGL